MQRSASYTSLSVQITLGDNTWISDHMFYSLDFDVNLIYCLLFLVNEYWDILLCEISLGLSLPVSDIRKFFTSAFAIKTRVSLKCMEIKYDNLEGTFDTYIQFSGLIGK